MQVRGIVPDMVTWMSPSLSSCAEPLPDLT